MQCGNCLSGSINQRPVYYRPPSLLIRLIGWELDRNPVTQAGDYLYIQNSGLILADKFASPQAASERQQEADTAPGDDKLESRGITEETSAENQKNRDMSSEKAADKSEGRPIRFKVKLI